jgi:RNA polymerase sigma-70 factor (ECF subfamily)
MEVNDKELVKKIVLEDNKDAFVFLVEKYKVKIFNFIYRMVSNYEDAQDLSQETFIRAYSYIHRFKPSGEFSHWIFRIALNVCYDFLKRKKKLKKAEEEYLIKNKKIESENELIEIVQEKIEKLPEKYKVVIILKYIEGLTYYEISQILSIPVGVVKIRIYRAKEKLYNELKEIF